MLIGGRGAEYAAPAPSPKMIEVPRSAGSSNALICSAATMSTCRVMPVRMRLSAELTAKQKTLHAALIAIQPAYGATAAAIRQVAGRSRLQEAVSTRSTSEAAMPARAGWTFR
jgi:hypothetical protein